MEDGSREDFFEDGRSSSSKMEVGFFVLLVRRTRNISYLIFGSGRMSNPLPAPTCSSGKERFPFSSSSDSPPINFGQVLWGFDGRFSNRSSSSKICLKIEIGSPLTVISRAHRTAAVPPRSVQPRPALPDPAHSASLASPLCAVPRRPACGMPGFWIRQMKMVELRSRRSKNP